MDGDVFPPISEDTNGLFNIQDILVGEEAQEQELPPLIFFSSIDT